ncbi:hypothetical protein QQ045_025458 [Rhodiola kirilowii]
MLSFHAKMAWKFVVGTSLWGRYMKAKYDIKEKGSAVWNSFAHLIPNIKENSIWHVGRGEIMVDTLCSYVGISCPDEARGLQVRDNEYKTELLNAIWELMLGTTHYAVCPWGGVIGQKWIPSKVSSFVWKLCWGGLPTDDKVMKLGINLASRCVCCKRGSESIKHLFVEGVWGTEVWRYLALVFNKPTVRGVEGFKRVWISKEPSSIVEGLQVGIACMAAWYIWKVRNNIIHDDHPYDFRRALFKWIFDMAHLINLQHKEEESGVIKFLGTSMPVARALQGRWLHWSPHLVGCTTSVALAKVENRCWGSIILRNARGVFSKRQDLAMIQCSHHFMSWFVEVNPVIPWDMTYKRRALLSHCGSVILKKICHMVNIVAIAYTGWYHYFDNFSSLPLAVRRAIRADMHGLVVFCPTEACDVPRGMHTRTMDDGMIGVPTMP